MAGVGQYETPPKIDGNFEATSIVSIKQFSPKDVGQVFAEADAMAQMTHEEGVSDLLKGVVAANLFYEPSTRTFLSFEAAAKRLGAETISTQGVEYSSIAKGETLSDTIRTVDRYADIITLRHSDVGAAAVAARVSSVPIINGGDGVGEHPTQALLDLYTIQHRFGSVENLTVTMVGDLKHGRTVHSLAHLLADHGVKLVYVSPDSLAMPESIQAQLREEGAKQETRTDLHEVVADSDVVYVTRAQKERFKPANGLFKTHRGQRAYNRVKNAYTVTPELLRSAKKDMIVMHPLPRNNEIHVDVDKDHRAAYFDEVESGMYVRMALLALAFGRSLRSTNDAPYRSIRHNRPPWTGAIRLGDPIISEPAA